MDRFERLISLVLSAHSTRACRATVGEGVDTGAGGGGAADGGGAGAGGGTGGDDPKQPDAIPLSQHNAGMARMRNDLKAIKASLEAAQAKLGEYEAKDKQAEEAKLTFEERAAKQHLAIKTDYEEKLAEAEAKAASQVAKRHELLKRNALLTAINKAGLYEPDLVADILAPRVSVTDGDEVVQDTDKGLVNVEEVVKAFAKERPRFVPTAQASGPGTRGGSAPRTGKKSIGEMTPGELEAQANAEIRGMLGTRGTASPLGSE